MIARVLSIRSSQDALLASRILVNLLRQEDIPYTLIPIGGYSELEARKNQIFGIDLDADEEEQVVSQDCEVRLITECLLT